MSRRWRRFFEPHQDVVRRGEKEGTTRNKEDEERLVIRVVLVCVGRGEDDVVMVNKK